MTREKRRRKKKGIKKKKKEEYDVTRTGRDNQLSHKETDRKHVYVKKRMSKLRKRVENMCYFANIF